MRLSRFLRSLYKKWRVNASKPMQKSSFPPLRSRLFNLELLEDRLTPTANIAITNAFLVNASDQPLTTVSVGEQVYVQVSFTTTGLPSNASYDINFNVNGLTIDTSNITYGAGQTGTESWYYYWGTFLATPGTNQVTVTVDPSHSVALTSYTDNAQSFTFAASEPQVAGSTLSYTVAQIRAAYGINNIADFGSTTADGTGQTIAIDDAYDDPTIYSDLNGFDNAMTLTATSAETLDQLYGAASSFLTVYNQEGVNISSELADSGNGVVPPIDPTGGAQGEITLDVEWAHAIAPGAKIDLIETNSYDSILTGDKIAAGLPGVSVVSNSYGLSQSSSDTGYDSSTFVTPSGHTGVTFLAASGDDGAIAPGASAEDDGYYPAVSPNVVAVGGTQLTVDNDGYGSETGWSFATPTSTVSAGGASYSQSGSWTSHAGGFDGDYVTATAGSSSSASFTVDVTSADIGWSDGVELSTTWAAFAGNATNATYTIYQGTAATGTVLGTVEIDQADAPVGTEDGSSEFQELGVFFPKLSANDTATLTVVLSAKSANGTIEADAVGVAAAWASTGGATDLEAEPSYQLPYQNTGYRTTPDVSFDASTNSGVTCYENGIVSYDYSGTSLACPCWAGLIAIANQGRVASGESTLDSTSDPEQTLQALYSLPSSDFHSITSGYNGYSADAGYNFVTGRGTPIANTLIPDLVAYGQSGQTGSNPTITGLSPATGPITGGETVIITGTNLSGATAVDFGSVAATSFSVISNTEIEAVDPAQAAGTVNVTVTTSAGTTATSSADQFTYVGSGPAITGLLPATDLVTGGETVVITGTNLTGATVVDFGSVAATSFSVISSTEIEAVDPAQAAGTVNVTVTTPEGTTATSSADQFTYFSSGPAITHRISLSASTVKSGSSITVTLQAENSNGSAITTGGLSVVFSLEHATGGQGTFSAVTYIGKGTYTATFTGTIAGSNVIVARIDGLTNISNTAAIKVVPGPVSLATSLLTISASSIEVGGTTTVTLQAKDAAGNNLTTGTLTIAFMLESASGGKGTFGKVVYRGNGVYTVTFKGTAIGSNDVTATIDDQLIASAPVAITVL